MRKFSRRTTIFMVATGVLLTASLAFAFVNVAGESLPFTANVAGEPPTGELEVTVETDGSVDLGPGLAAEQLKIIVKNKSPFAVTLAAEPVTLEVASGPGSEGCDAEDLVLESLDDLPNEELAPEGEADDTEDDIVFLSLNDDEGSSSAEDCQGAELQITVKVTGASTEDIPGESPTEEISGSAGL